MLAVTYSVVVPIGRGADEWAHYWYAQFIAQHGRLPANPAEREAAGYKSDWPPLYHLFAAGVTAWVGTDGSPTFKYRSENIRRQLVPALGPEAILHTEDELFPWRQEILVWHLGRFLSIVFSLGTLLVTYFFAFDVFSEFHTNQPEDTLSRPSQIPDPHTLALASVAVLAFNPRFLFTGMLFNYDSLTLLISSLFLWLVIRVAKDYHLRWGFCALGALAGLALITKYLTSLLPLEIILLVLIRSSHQQSNDTSLTEPKRTGGTPTPASGNTIVTTNHVSRFTHPAIRSLAQAGFAFVLVTSWWFAYLLINFNEIETYGPVLGSVAPLLRGDGSDRTVEAIFAFLGGDRTPAPDFIEKQHYTAWQIVAELPTTFWGNPIIRPYPLNWFIIVMTVVVFVAAIGLAWHKVGAGIPGSNAQPTSRLRSILAILLLHCLLPGPFMLIRLFGVRDALEAVQGRHILFLTGPAIAVLLVWGLAVFVSSVRSKISGHESGVSPTTPSQTHFGSQPLTPDSRLWSASTHYALLFTLQALLVLLLTGAIGQLLLMKQTYPPLLPVWTTPYRQTAHLLSEIQLDGGAWLIDYHLEDLGHSLKVALIWRGGAEPPPEDYQVELVLVDPQGQTRAGWLAYQTQAHYPTRTWEPGDVIRDEGWLPLTGLSAGDYELRMRLFGQADEVIPWQTLATYHHDETKPSDVKQVWHLLYHGEVSRHPPTLRERETAQFAQPPTLQQSSGQVPNLQSPIPNPHLTGPDEVPRAPVSAGPTWANFIIQPDWPAGDYWLDDENEVVLRVAPNDRDFTVLADMIVPLEADFAGQIKLLGYHLPTRRVQPGDGLPVTLYWQGLHWLGEDFVIFNHLLDNQQVVRGGYDRLAREDYSTLLWAPGEIVTDGFAVPVAVDAPDGVYTLSLGWYRRVDGAAASLHLLNPDTGEPLETTAVTIGPIKVGGPPAGATVAEAVPHHLVEALLGEQIMLLGFDIEDRGASESANEKVTQPDTESAASPPQILASSSLTLTLYWQALAPPETDYTVFVHVRDAAGKVAAQRDRPPLAGAYPTSLWDAGEIIWDGIRLPLDQLEPGQYELVIGMYDFATDTRLPVEDSPDGTILLQSFEVLAE